MTSFTVFVCIATLVVSIQSLTEEKVDRIKRVHKECQADPKTHADEELVEKCYKGEQVDKSVVGAHILCMSTKFGNLNEDGKINKSNLKKEFSTFISDDTKLNQAVDKCAVEKNDPQDTALALLKCFQEQINLNVQDDHYYH